MPRRKATDLAGSRPARTRTRSGCQICRASKVKCDEKKPTCSRCWQRGLPCRPALVCLKWESDFVRHGLAFGRTGRWKKKKSSSGSDSSSEASLYDSGLQEWCPVLTVQAWGFVNSDISTFKQPNIKCGSASASKRANSPDPVQSASGDNNNDLTTILVPLPLRGPKAVDCEGLSSLSPPPLARNLSFFPSYSCLETTHGSLFFDYYLDQVCPRTTSSCRSPSPFVHLVLPFCVTASPTLFKAIQALGACHWSRSNPSWATVGLRLKSEVLGELRSRLSPTTAITTAAALPAVADDDDSLKCTMDPETLVVMMMLCLYELTDSRGDNQAWVVHLRGAKDIISLQRQHQNAVTSQNRNNNTQISCIDSFARRFFAFQDVIGRTACGDVALFGTDFWRSNERTVDLWMGCSPELVSILATITELSRSRRIIFSTPQSKSDPLHGHNHATSMFSAQAASLKQRLSELVQIVQDDRDETLVISAELKRLAAILYLDCALHGTTPSNPLVIQLVRQILQLVSTLLQRGVVASMTWPLFVAAVALGPDSLLDDGDGDDAWTDHETGTTICGRRLVLEALASMARSNLTNVTLTRAVVVKVWHARDINSTTSSSSPVDYSAGLESPECNDWEWYVAPMSAGMSLA